MGVIRTIKKDSAEMQGWHLAEEIFNGKGRIDSSRGLSGENLETPQSLQEFKIAW